MHPFKPVNKRLKDLDMNNETIFNRRSFLRSSAALAAVLAGGLPAGAEEPARGIRTRFLGSGAASWKPEWAQGNPHMRRQSSVLLDNRVLIDFTPCSFDKLPAGCRPEALFQTHSHGDHYSPEAAVKVGVKRVYVHETWAAAAQREIAAAAAKLGLPAPEVRPLAFGRAVTEGGLAVTAVPSNHSTSRVTDGVLERTAMYLVEKGPARLVYATDTGGIPGDAARMIGIDAHVSEGNYAQRFADNPFVHRPEPVTAFIMEATNGDLDDDFRVFVHSGVPTVARIVSALKKTGRYRPPAGQPAYITHLGIKYRGWSSDRIQAELPEGLRAASDGLEVVLG